MNDSTDNNHSESVEELSLFQRLIGIVISPGKTIRQINQFYTNFYLFLT